MECQDELHNLLSMLGQLHLSHIYKNKNDTDFYK